MNKKKGDATNIAGISDLKNQLTTVTNKINSNGESISMNNDTPTRNKIQLDLFSPEQPKKVNRTIHCGDCHHERPLDGYRFGLMPVCSDCRTKREVKITGNRFERRHKR